MVTFFIYKCSLNLHFLCEICYCNKEIGQIIVKTKKNNKKKYNRKPNKKSNVSKIRLFLNAIFVLLLLANIITIPLKINFQKPYIQKVLINQIRKQNRKRNINKCLKSKELNESIQSSVVDLEKELINYLEQYNIGFKYVEKNLKYEISYNSDKEFYGASLIKLLDADYLLDNDVDLSNKKTYEKKYKMGYSSEVSKYKIGDDISLENLMKYAISVSDNSAHLMLIDYIGFNNLKEYGQSLGGKYVLEGGDLFGNQSADDMIIYLNKAYELINSKEKGIILKEAMLNTEVNYLNFDDVSFGHKYGSYNSYYHDVGIYFSDNPYLIAILSTNDKRKETITEISKKVYNIHNKLIEAKKNYCNKLK